MQELLAKGPQNIRGSPRGLAASHSSFPPNSGDSGVLHSDLSERCRRQVNSSSDPIAPRDATNFLPLSLVFPAPSQLLSDTSVLNSPLISPSKVGSPTDVRYPHDMIPATSRPYPDEDTYADNDPEDIRALLCSVLVLDKNAKDNSLPFVLYCYSQWAITIIFEPLKVISAMRDQVTAHFSTRDARTRTILIANLMKMFVKNLTIDGSGTTILRHLAKDAHMSGATFVATPPSCVPVLDRQNAVRVLDSMLEMLELQWDTQPTFECIQSLEYAAPVFRRACPEPPGRPLNLANILLDFSVNLRYFATVDVIRILTTGLPTCFQYEVPFSLELCERIYHWQLQGNYGLQWLYGIPDQFILLFAWINSRSETLGDKENIRLTTWVESLLPQIELALDERGDPLLRIGRMVVQECWRFAVQIYLYMVLCKADARDIRVIQAQKGYMRLIRTVKAGRNPDLHLILSMAVAGVATIEEKDRNTIRYRILNVREHAERGTAGNDILRTLEDIWARARDEGRAAAWSDLNIAYARLTGR